MTEKISSDTILNLISKYLKSVNQNEANEVLLNKTGDKVKAVESTLLIRLETIINDYTQCQLAISNCEIPELKEQLAKFTSLAEGMTFLINNIDRDNLGLTEVEECSICLDSLTEALTELTCKHEFHTQCIDRWMEINNSCPYCRHTIS